MARGCRNLPVLDRRILDRFLSRHPRQAWAFDVDGTLLDLAPAPEAVVVPPGLEAALLARLGGGLHLLALVSGRDLPSLRRLFPALEAARARGATIYLIGNHGAEWAGPEAAYRADAAAEAARPLLAGLGAALPALIAAMPGVRLEDKGLSLTLHYRASPPGTGRRLEATLEAALTAYEGRLLLAPAKEAWEIRPVDAPTKGRALRALLDRRYGPGWADTVGVVLFGDDYTDESAFLALPEALSCRVGPLPLRGAGACLPDPGSLRRLLATC